MNDKKDKAIRAGDRLKRAESRAKRARESLVLWAARLSVGWKCGGEAKSKDLDALAEAVETDEFARRELRSARASHTRAVNNYAGRPVCS